MQRKWTIIKDAMDSKNMDYNKGLNGFRESGLL